MLKRLREKSLEHFWSFLAFIVLMLNFSILSKIFKMETSKILDIENIIIPSFALVFTFRNEITVPDIWIFKIRTESPSQSFSTQLLIYESGMV